MKVNNELKYDAQLWLEFLENFNGVVFFPEKEWVNNGNWQLFTDSTGCENLGCGAYADGEWVQLRWPNQWKRPDVMRDITFLELVLNITGIVYLGS